MYIITVLFFSLILATSQKESSKRDIMTTVSQSTILKAVHEIGKSCLTNTDTFDYVNGNTVYIRLRLMLCEKLINFDFEDISEYKITEIPTSFENFLEEVDLRNLPDSDSPKATNPALAFLPLEHIWNYGCWCYFGDNSSTVGAGPTVDYLDSLCKDLQLCYKCAKIDSLNNGEEICHPEKTDYTIKVKSSYGSVNLNNSILFDCTSKNFGNDCAIHTCCCETTFLAGLLSLFFQGYLFENNKYDRKLGHWRNDICHGNSDRTVLDCCGKYSK